MKRYGSRPLRALFLLLLVTVVGCSFLGEQPPTQFFVLNAVGEDSAYPPAEPAGEVAVGVAPVDFPTYLDRREIVTRSSTNELVINRYFQWASPLRSDFERVLAANLGTMIPTRRAPVLPFRRAFPLDYEVRMSVDRFERLADGAVVLDARWIVIEQAREKTIKVNDARIRVPNVPVANPAVVSAMSRALAELSRTVAADIPASPPRRGS